MLDFQQRTILKAAIDADPAMSAYSVTPDGAVELAKVLNDNAPGGFWVWRTSLSPEQYREAYNWDEIETWATAQAGKKAVWDYFTLNQTRVLNPSKLAQRSKIANIFATATVTLAAIQDLFDRKATVLEKLFATGTGTHGSPGTLVVEGVIGYKEVLQARRGQ